MELVYGLKVEIQQLVEDGDYRYMATSPDLPNLVVAGDTIEEILAEVPAVARALFQTMEEVGQPLPDTLKVEPGPYQANLPIVV